MFQPCTIETNRAVETNRVQPRSTVLLSLVAASCAHTSHHPHGCTASSSEHQCRDPEGSGPFDPKSGVSLKSSKSPLHLGHALSNIMQAYARCRNQRDQKETQVETRTLSMIQLMLGCMLNVNTAGNECCNRITDSDHNQLQRESVDILDVS